MNYYGIIGNGYTCALINPLGSIDWFCLPDFDGDLIFTRALDPTDGESLTLHFFEQKKELAYKSARQEYIPKTNILKTIIEFRGLTATIIDFMPWTYRGGEQAIVRHISLLNSGKKRRTIEVVSKTRKPLGKDPDYRELLDGDIILQNEKYALGIICRTKKLMLSPREEKFTSIILCYENTVKQLNAVMESWRHRSIDETIRSTREFWSNWLARGRPIDFSGVDAEVIERGLLCMKLLQYAPTGAFVAAPTASFPAYPGLNDNWDYRFCWIRDTYFAARSFLLTGHFDEVRASLKFLMKLQGKDGHWEQPFYTITGALPPKEIVLENLRGPNREINIRINNGARDQLQIDSEGSVLHLLYMYYLFSRDKEFLEQMWNSVENAADWLVKNAHRPENGIWEFREREMHWTYGKVLCYAGLESACKLAEVLDKPCRPWMRSKEALKKKILVEAWSEQRNAFLQTYDEDAPLDISVLALEDYGLIPADSAKMKKTVDKIEKHLLFEGGVRRYEAAILPFFMPTLWLASHYIKSGEQKRARELLDHAIKNMTSLYLAAEHYDPRTGMQHGNFPQLFCMSMFVEQLILFHHKPSIVENLNLLTLPFEKTIELVDALLINPLLKISDKVSGEIMRRLK